MGSTQGPERIHCQLPSANTPQLRRRGHQQGQHYLRQRQRLRGNGSCLQVGIPGKVGRCEYHLLLGSFSRQYTLLHFSYYVAVQAKSAYGYGNWTKDVYVNVPDKNTTVDNNYSWLISYFVMTTFLNFSSFCPLFFPSLESYSS